MKLIFKNSVIYFMKFRYSVIVLLLLMIGSCQKKGNTTATNIIVPKKADSVITPPVVAVTYPYTDTFIGQLADSFYENSYYVPVGPPVSLIVNNSFIYFVKHISADTIFIYNPVGIVLDNTDNPYSGNYTYSLITKTDSSGTYSPKVREGDRTFHLINDSLYMVWYNLTNCGQDLSVGGFAGKK